MGWQDLSMSDIRRLVVAIVQAAGGNETAIRDIINRTPNEPMPHGRVTLGMVQQLLEQTNGSTVLPDAIAAQLQQPETLALPVGGSVNYHLAQQIMGRSFFTMEDVQEKFGVNFSQELQSDLMDKVPFSESTLRDCQETHMLFPGYPLSIMDIHTKTERITPRLFYFNSWYKSQSFAATELVEPRWYLLRKDALPYSTDKTFVEQQHMVGLNEVIPRACEFTYGVMLYALVTGVRLFGSATEYVRCIDYRTDTDDIEFIVGFLDRDGMAFDHKLHSINSPRVGLAVCRRPEC